MRRSSRCPCWTGHPRTGEPADLARRTAFRLTPHRFEHVHAVWRLRAAELRQLDIPWLEPAMSNRLELAALLHDVGRTVTPTTPSPTALPVRDSSTRSGSTTPHPSCAPLGARLEAAARGMADREPIGLRRARPPRGAHLLDRTTNPAERVSLAQRRHDIAVRYGVDSLHVWLFDATLPDVRHAEWLLARDAVLPRAEQAGHERLRGGVEVSAPTRPASMWRRRKRGQIWSSDRLSGSRIVSRHEA